MNTSLIRLAGFVVALTVVPAALNAGPQGAPVSGVPVPVRQGAVVVSGQVRSPGEQFLTAGESLTVTAAILKAGGLSEWANSSRIQVSRQSKDGSTEKFEVDFKRIAETGDIQSDPVLQDGDRIYVPKIGHRF